MKKALLVLAVLCVAGIFSAKAQSPSDSSYARDLSYVYLSTSSLPATTTGSLTSTSKLLKDIRIGSATNGYAFTLSSAGWYDIDVLFTNFDGYIYLLDANFNAIDSNDSYSSSYRNKMLTQLQAGQYYLLVCDESNGLLSSSYSYTLTLKKRTNVKDVSTLTYTAKTFGTPIVDTLGANCEIVKDSTTNGYFYNAKGYTMQIPAGYMELTFDRSNRDVALFDNNNNLINDFYMSPYFNVPQSGTYKLIIISFEDIDNDTTLSTLYTITTDTVNVATFLTLPYQSISLGSTISDTLRDTDPYLASHPRAANYPCISTIPYAKGYRIQTSATTRYLDFVVDSNNFDTYIFLLDSNKNLITYNDDYGSSDRSRIFVSVTPSTTYYLVISSYSYGETGWFHFYTRGIQSLPAIYVDGVNGNDSRNGLTPQTALATLDTAFARTQGIGRYYLTDDYTFNSPNYLTAYYSEIHPYGKDINLKTTDSCNEYSLLYANGTLVFGTQDSNHYFIIDSNHTDFSEGFIYGEYGGRVELNKVKVRNSYFSSDFITYADDVVIRDCEFSNDTIGDDFVQTNYEVFNSVKLINVDFTQNYMRYYLFYNSYYSVIDTLNFVMENTNIVGNTFDYPQMGFTYCNADLRSGSWRNNNLSAAYSSNGNPNLTIQNCAGIWLWGSSVNIGAGFTMDANNYLCIDSSSTITITENLTAPLVAQIYPYKWDDDDEIYIADYYEGRTLLTGSASMLRANYQKFSVAQADNASLWYLHSDGKIYTTEEQIDIETAENADIRMFPNPAADKVTVELQNTTATEICVMDIYGKTVIRQAVGGQSEVLDLGKLAKGMYFVQIRNNGKVETTQKLIKK